MWNQLLAILFPNSTQRLPRPRRRTKRVLQFQHLGGRALTAIDLDPYNIDAPSEGIAGKEVTVFTDIDNRGSNASGSYKVSYYLSTNSTITSSDTLLRTINRSSINAWAYHQWNEPVTLPTNAVGKYWIGVIVDPQNSVKESNESNNAQADGNSINVAAALVPAELQGEWIDVQQSSAQWGQTITLSTLQIRNAGAGAAGNFQIQWYLSRDKYGSSDDILLLQSNGATTYNHGGIAANSLADGHFRAGPGQGLDRWGERQEEGQKADHITMDRRH
jgi:subtilase family serine protease